jgi:parallel beta-helix repeat protein
MVQSPSAPTFYVNPSTGNDSAVGSQASPFKTVTRALRQAAASTTIRLSVGTYSTATGEVFPLGIPAGVIVVGNEGNKGNGTVIEGNGQYVSPTFNQQNVAIRIDNDAQLRGVTVSNRAAKGTGVWIESTAPTIANCTFIHCGREGVFATGTANPLISDSVFQQNAASGMSIVRNAKGEIRRNLCQRTGYGIAIGGNAAPLLVDNRTTENRAGIVLSDAARPVLRNNQIDRNTTDGLVVLNNALPDLGKSQDPGGNVFQSNQAFDLRNSTSVAVVSAGNQLNPTRVSGAVMFAVSQVLFPSSAPAPVPVAIAPTPRPAPAPTPQPTPGGVQLPDIGGYWAEGFIKGLVDRGIISGFPDGTFKPDLNITRAQYAAAIAKAFNLPLKQASSGFVDVPGNFWAAAAIAKAAQMGFIAGFPDGTFRPSQNLTRIQAIVSIVNGLELMGGNPNALAVYRDRAQIPSYATNAVASATQKRLVVNYPQVDLLNPLVDITRAEVAAILYQALVATGQAMAIASAFIVNPDFSVPSFIDIQEHWSGDFVRGLASQGLITGFADGSFQPETGMNRAQYATLLANSFHPLPERPPANFTDIPSDFWAARAIDRVYRGGLLSGANDSTFQPSQNISRLEVVLSLVNALNLPAGNLNVLTAFTDSATIPAHLRGAIAAAIAHQIVVYTPHIGQLNLNQAATRGEVAAMVYQALVKSARSPAIDSPYVVSGSHA